MKEKDIIIKYARNIPIEQLLTLDYFKNRGSQFTSRALIDDSQGKRELAFSDAIKEHQENSNPGIDHITEGNEDFNTIAFTVFQWLATNIGNHALEVALEKTGRKIVPIKQNSYEWNLGYDAAKKEFEEPQVGKPYFSNKMATRVLDTLMAAQINFENFAKLALPRDAIFSIASNQLNNAITALENGALPTDNLKEVDSDEKLSE